jgi:AmmeMemoRadiSam system protein A
MRSLVKTAGLIAALMAAGMNCAEAKEPDMKKTYAPDPASSDDAVVTAAEKEFLLKLARQTLELYLKNQETPRVDKKQLSERLTAERGCFVTLDHKDSGLRGCIGYIFPVKSLYESIIDNAVNAAVHDPRFPRVSPAELPDILVSISVLTVPQDLAFSSPQDLRDKLVPGRDGVVLKTRYGSSTFLPQVWDDLPDKEEFLGHLCRKHGAPVDEWKMSGVSVQTYRAVVFKEDGR